ncbi:dioxygenase [Microbacterium sp. bgisy203]|uniref:dioxygenase n=1 Tax=Microbacterium sp. bgisy203 TaxID=3413799 RepID=UPI003D72479D
MASGSGKKQSREEKERARLYHARQEFHDGLITRRRRDNLIAGIGGGILLLAIIGGQIAYFSAGPGAPVPSPTPSPSGSTAPAVEPTPIEPTPAETPPPTETPAP